MRFARAAVISVAAVSACLLVGCSESESGTPEAGEGSSNSSVATQPGAPDESASATPLADFDPCSVLRTEEVAKYGPIKKDAPSAEQHGSARVCSWDGDLGDSAQLVPTTSVAVRENGGVQDMNDKGYGVDQTSENGRSYGRSPGPNGCTVSIGVTDTSRIDIAVTSLEATKACEMANELVEVAEPRVPKG